MRIELSEGDAVVVNGHLYEVHEVRATTGRISLEVKCTPLSAWTEHVAKGPCQPVDSFRPDPASIPGPTLEAPAYRESLAEFWVAQDRHIRDTLGGEFSTESIEVAPGVVRSVHRWTPPVPAKGVGASGSDRWWEGGRPSPPDAGGAPQAVAGSRQTDGREECYRCGRFVFMATHSCKGVPVTAAARTRFKAEREQIPPAPAPGVCRFCRTPIRRDNGSWKGTEGGTYGCPGRTEGIHGHSPYMCHCGGPEESAYGHALGEGMHCRG